MGLFTSSETTNKRNQILQDIAVINQSLRKIADILDNQGINSQSINAVNQVFMNFSNNVERMSSTVQSMRDSQLDGFSVPWMDGRYMGIMMWLGSFNMVMNQIQGEINGYYGR